MAEEIDVENGRNSNFEGLVTLTLTFDRAIRNISLTIHTFGKHLKTHFFFLVERGRGAFVTFMISLRRIQMFLLTYLLTYTAYRPASIIDLYLYTKFHSN